ncbi:unnamed protein product [Paramecium octaurelia]|uniref:Uncharacterized protein n=1 Tax=Paramecium octaurelia TaxID=43137 RepID=A0A8S1VW76_PAROT|nr:unnamed protein product [Paramecium octaurelia]
MRNSQNFKQTYEINSNYECRIIQNNLFDINPLVFFLMQNKKDFEQTFKLIYFYISLQAITNLDIIINKELSAKFKYSNLGRQSQSQILNRNSDWYQGSRLLQMPLQKQMRDEKKNIGIWKFSESEKSYLKIESYIQN